MKVPRDIRGEHLVKLLGKYDYVVTRQTGSHIRLTRSMEEDHHITIPKHKTLKIGTLNSIIKKVGENLGKSKEEVLIELFEEE
ncbi:MAG: type II toxin-antitoxin system HicA family toxin [Candidatus Aminicenantes bacterium]|nr:type II toxin-antitoxin system HicA family toxin [Candidatus Aminicenantes bacterium]